MGVVTGRGVQTLAGTTAAQQRDGTAAQQRGYYCSSTEGMLLQLNRGDATAAQQRGCYCSSTEGMLLQLNRGDATAAQQRGYYCSSTEGMLVEGQTIQEWQESTHNINSWVCLGNPGRGLY